MPITPADLEYYKSNAAGSTGGTITATAVTDNSLNNLFDDVTSDESVSGASEYRKIFVKNNHGSLTWQNVAYWRSSDTVSVNDEVWLGMGTASDDDGANELSALSVASVIAVVSDGADTRQITLVGEDAGSNRVTETLTLNGTTEVVGVVSFTKLYLAYPSASSALRIVTVRQGAGGVSRGTIGLNKLSAILYLNVTSKATGLELGNIAAGNSQGLWIKRIVAPGAAAATANQGTIKCEGDTT